MLPSAEVLSKLVGGLYGAASDPALWDAFLGQLAENTGAQSAGLVMLDAGKEVFTMSRTWNVDPEFTVLYRERYAPMDVWAQRGLAKRTGFVSTSEKLCPLSELASTEVYNDFMVRFGIEHAMFVVAENTGPRLASVSLYRDSSHPKFTTSDLDILHVLAPHVRRAFKLHFQFEELRSSVAGVDAALDLLPMGVVFLGRGGKVLRMNRSASACVGEKDGLLASRLGLGAELAAESSLLEKTIREAATTLGGTGLSAGGTVMVSRRKRGPLQVQISPIRGAVSAGSEAIVAVAFITDPTQRMRPPDEVLRARYGLTPAECRVALLLVDGLAAKEIAGTVGVTVDTVRSQIRSIFGKTGVNRQSDLIRLLMSGARAVIGGI